MKIKYNSFSVTSITLNSVKSTRVSQQSTKISKCFSPQDFHLNSTCPIPAHITITNKHNSILLRRDPNPLSNIYRSSHTIRSPKFRHPPLSIHSIHSDDNGSERFISGGSSLPWRLRVGVGALLNQPRPRRS